MGLLNTLKSWLGSGGDAASEPDAATEDTPSEEPKLDPNGATETRVKSTDSAVDTLKQTRTAAGTPESDDNESTSSGETSDEEPPAETADANLEE